MRRWAVVLMCVLSGCSSASLREPTADRPVRACRFDTQRRFDRILIVGHKSPTEYWVKLSVNSESGFVRWAEEVRNIERTGVRLGPCPDEHVMGPSNTAPASGMFGMPGLEEIGPPSPDR